MKPQASRTESANKNVALVMILSTLARALSLFASVRYTAYFGYTLETDIYSYAVNLPNIIFTCIGTALVTVVIPIFAGRLAAGEPEKAYGFIDRIITVSLIAASALALSGILVSPFIVSMINNFDTGNPTLALFALRLMFPVMIFHAVTYILSGVLQTNNRFIIPSIVSAFSGMSIILYVTFFADLFGVKGLLVATFVGLALQGLSLIAPVALGTGYRFRPRFELGDGDIRKVGRLAIPVLISSSSYQFNMFVNSTFAAGFDGGVITITNMQTLAFTAAQLFILSTLTVYFPRMSKKHATGDMDGFRESFHSVLRLITVFALPASVALAVLSRQVITLIYGYGRVSLNDLSLSSSVFAIYALSIFVIGFKEALDRAFYAAQDSKIPAAAGVIIMVVNVALSFVLMQFVGLSGLPLAYLIAMTSGALALALIHRKRALPLRNGSKSAFLSLFLRCALSSVVMSLIIHATDTVLLTTGVNFDSSVPLRVFRLALLTVTGCVSYLSFAAILGVSEIKQLFLRFLHHAN